MKHAAPSGFTQPMLLALAVCLAGWMTSQASTVVPLPVSRLADHAGQVIVGRVDTVRSYWADNPRRIESEVTFKEVEYLKGRLADSTERFTLVVPGGLVDSTRMTVCCAPELRVGEKWLLFLLPTYRTHPVVGIYQGAFLIQPDADGVERVVSRTHGRESKVVGIATDGFIQYAQGQPADVHQRLQEAHGIRLAEPQTAPQSAIAYADFVTQLTPVLTTSRDHQLTAPAGKPDIVTQRAVPLQPSRLEQQRRAEKKPADPAPPLRGEDAARPRPATPAKTNEQEVRP